MIPTWCGQTTTTLQIAGQTSYSNPERERRGELPFARPVARAMLGLADHFGQEVEPGRIVIHQKIGQNDLAAMAGIVRENVTRVLNDWQRAQTGSMQELSNRALAGLDWLASQILPIRFDHCSRPISERQSIRGRRHPPPRSRRAGRSDEIDMSAEPRRPGSASAR